MSLLNEAVCVPRRAMTLFFVIDTSGSMAGSKIGAVNDAIANVLPMLGEISESNPDAEIKIAALMFADKAKWLYSEPKSLNDFEWKDASADGMTALGAACDELDSKLSRSGFMSCASGSYAPAVILLSDGEPNDDYEKGIRNLKANKWFGAAIKMAIAIGEDADTNILAEFTGSIESVITVHNIDALRQIIRIMAVTSSQIGSKSASIGDSSKQDQVASAVKQNLQAIEGAYASALTKDGYDDWS